MRIKPLGFAVAIFSFLVVTGACGAIATPRGNWTPPLLDEGQIYAAGVDASTSVISRIDRDTLGWDTSFNPAITSGRVAIYSNLVSNSSHVYGAGYSCNNADCETSIFGAPKEVGTGLSSISRTVAGKVVGDIAISGENLFVPISETSDQERAIGFIRSYDLATMTELGFLEFEAELLSGLVIEDGVAFVGSVDGMVYAINIENPSSMQILWQHELGSSTLTKPLLVDGTLLIGGFSANDNFVALDATTGALKWSYTADAWIWAEPLVSEDKTTVYVTDFDGGVYALNLATGSPIWAEKAEILGRVVAKSAIVTRSGQNFLAVPSLDGGVHLVATQNGFVRVGEVFDTIVGVASEPLVIENDAGRRLHVVNLSGQLITFSIDNLTQQGCLYVPLGTTRCQ